MTVDEGNIRLYGQVSSRRSISVRIWNNWSAFLIFMSITLGALLYGSQTFGHVKHQLKHHEDGQSDRDIVEVELWRVPPGRLDTVLSCPARCSSILHW